MVLGQVPLVSRKSYYVRNNRRLLLLVEEKPEFVCLHTPQIYLQGLVVDVITIWLCVYTQYLYESAFVC